MCIRDRAAEGKLRRAVYLNFGVLLAAVLVHYLCPVLLPWSLDCALYAVSFLPVSYTHLNPENQLPDSQLSVKEKEAA